ncbi:MAG: DegT/DnrJ/EryC1/StrS family aminotransferase [Rhodospirillaceae bacterium]|nr:DegT/DnrJ/EryC1/StrS family aminotransferase [Rhodospirillaceae bacterium]MBT5373836.1 DegT/DnrJ/EryC1/StrS family aminotransferase [Rhodospirillaceae bacterium]MBT5658949.1 DegT/DnrJ/EryC1/StrS family aminotransferase [Rhodospirillaceae bacterium]MBT5752091.1 DegT/DnrJ/EryC1/StrS family aminotransferase [Rhodospirillaceae bacterium]
MRKESAIKFVDLAAQFEGHRDEIMQCVERVFVSGKFVGGEEVDLFEKEVADYCGVSHAVALNSGTDALMLGMSVLGIGPGDEVITPPNSFIASTAAIARLGATPIFADVRDDMNIDPDKFAAAISPRTKAVMPVHLTGRIADMDPILEIAQKNNLIVVEDASQAFGSLYKEKIAGSFGHMGCFSAHPLKNLNAAGDAGFLLTDDAEVAEKMASLRNHGIVGKGRSEIFGVVSRMDTIQAALLRLKLKLLPEVIRRRRDNAKIYRELLDDVHIYVPPEKPYEFNTYHTMVIRVERRDQLRRALSEKNIGSAIHYETPIHLQPAAVSLGYKAGDFPITEQQAGNILSIPVHQDLMPGDIERVVETINGFYG